MKNVVYEKLNIILAHDLPLTDTKASIVDKYQLYVLHDIYFGSVNPIHKSFMSSKYVFLKFWL